MLDLVAVKKTFFDAQAVADKLDPALRKALAKFGAFVRTRAKSSIRSRKASSPPGSPPSSHAGTLKRFILFGYDERAKSVVIGPTLAGKQTGAPETLEYGGTALLKRKSGNRVATYAPRPYMAPAFKTELAKVGNNFRNLIR